MSHGTAFAARSAETCLLENTSFIGRDRALAELLEAVDQERLTTLWGAAGVGKTRLLRRACAETAARGRVTVVEVMDLVPARDRAALVAAVAQALGLSLATSREDQTVPAVGAALARAGGMLLALDGLEHLVPHAEVIAAWLRAAPALRVLCTSRTPLALPGEHPLKLEPLSLTSGVALFEDRVRAITGRALEPDEHGPAERAVRALGTLPLAIELAAARAAIEGISTTEASLQRELPTAAAAGELTATGSASAAMPALVRWSMAPLSHDERAALRQLACCADGVALDIAEAVVGVGEPLELIVSLRRRSLLWTRHGRQGELRCGIYASVREALAGEAAPVDVADRHARVLAAWAAPIAARARAQTPGAIEELLDGSANLELALSRAVDDVSATTIAVAVSAAAGQRGSRDAHAALFERGLAAARRAGLLELELDLLERQATLAGAGGAVSHSLAIRQAALEIAARLGDRDRLVMARAALGWDQFQLGHCEDGLAQLHAAIDATSGSEAGALAHNRLGAALFRLGEPRALEELTRAASLAAATDCRSLRASALLDLAGAHRRRGAVELASQRLLEAGALGPVLDQQLRARFLLERAALARVSGRFDDATRLGRDALHTAEAVGAPAILAEAHAAAAALALDLDDVDAACVAANAACAQAALLETGTVLLEGELARARARRAAGDLAGALAALDAADRAQRRAPSREALGLIALERALIEGAAEGTTAQLARELTAMMSALLPLGGRPAALALAVRALLEPEHAEHAGLVEAARAPLDDEARALLAFASGEVVDTRRFALTRAGAALRRAPVRREMIVDGDGRYYEIDGRRISLARQRSLRLIFLALVDQAERRPGHGLPQPEVLARGWPGEKMRPDSGATRVYTSIRRLRRGGLEGVLVTRDDGYLIDPHVAVRRVAHA